MDKERININSVELVYKWSSLNWDSGANSGEWVANEKGKIVVSRAEFRVR